MTDTPEDLSVPSRRHLLKCSAWAGTGVAWAMAGGVPRAFALDALPKGASRFLFVQISDTHIGFNKDANPDVAGTLTQTIALANALPRPPRRQPHRRRCRPYR